jgi:predicted patatin/cPLA2 family phospholipase
MEQRPERYNMHIAAIRDEEKKENCLVICPPEPLPIQRTENDPDSLEQTYQIGRVEAMRKMTEIRTFLQDSWKVKQ